MTYRTSRDVSNDSLSSISPKLCEASRYRLILSASFPLYAQRTTVHLCIGHISGIPSIPYTERKKAVKLRCYVRRVVGFSHLRKSRQGDLLGPRKSSRFSISISSNPQPIYLLHLPFYITMASALRLGCATLRTPLSVRSLNVRNAGFGAVRCYSSSKTQVRLASSWSECIRSLKLTTLL